MDQILAKEEPDASDKAQLEECLNRLKDNNNQILDRSNELYKAAKTKTMQLQETDLKDVLDRALEHFKKKYPDAFYENLTDARTALSVWADPVYLSEAIYNILINAYEAQVMADQADRPIVLNVYRQGRYVVAEVRDWGGGLTRQEKKQIFDPFYSKKNSNNNWGLGLYHVRSIVKAHMGQIRVESEKGKGSCFYIMLPGLD